MTAPAFFLHIPRTAGTTLNSILNNNFAPEEVLSIYDKSDYEAHRSHSPDELSKIKLIQGHLLLPQYNPPSIYNVPVRVFTFVREPIGRLVSEYFFLRSWEPNHLYTYLNENKISFAEYLCSTEKRLKYRGKNFMVRSISGMDTEGKNRPVKALSRAKKHLESVFGFVGVQERFNESLLLLADFLGLKNLLYEKKNALQTSAKEELADSDIALARELNQGDIELYEFACEVFSAKIAEKGEAFATQLEQFNFTNQKFQKISALLLERTGSEQSGDIIQPKDSLWR